MATINYLEEEGATMDEVAQRYGYTAGWLSRWLSRLERFESDPFEAVIYDDPRPGRPSKITDDEREQFERALQHPPQEVGYDPPAWPSKLAKDYLKREFEEEYTLRHVRRLLDKAGLSYQPPRPQPPTAEDDEREECRKDFKKVTRLDSENYTTVVIDQTRKAVGCDLYRAWFPEGERVSLPFWQTDESVKLLGALTASGETFFAPVEDSFPSEITVHFLRALQDEFGEHLHVIRDYATYFTSNRVSSFVEESELRVSHLPPGSPDMNPVEECWWQFKRVLGNR